MGAAGTVNKYLAQGDDGAEIDLDLGGDDPSTADHAGPAGDDSPPLPGDFVAALELDGVTQTMVVAGYADSTERVAEPGEKRIYARDSAGAVVSEVHLKGAGEIVIRRTSATGSSITISPDGSITLKQTAGTVSIDASGAIKLSGVSVAMQAGAALGAHFLALHAGISAWVPVPMDGGAALKAALAAYIAQTPPGP